MLQNPYAIIILAAGNSSRLGEPKQMLKHHGKTLIRHVAEEALAAKSAAVIVVTGFHAAFIEEELSTLSYHTVYNQIWESGMASSLVAGINELVTLHPNIAGTIFAVSDQPFVNAKLFNELIEEATKTNSGIVASSYGNTLGTPVLFSRKYFPELLNLYGADGAKKLVARFADDVTSIPFPLGDIDIDTQEDYQKLLLNS